MLSSLVANVTHTGVEAGGADGYQSLRRPMTRSWFACLITSAPYLASP